MSIEEPKKFNGCYYDQRTGTIRDRNGQAVKLRPQAVAMFQYLADHGEKLVSRSDLIEFAWPDVVVTEDSLTKCISEIRKAIGDGDHKKLVTVPKRGYILNPDNENSVSLADQPKSDSISPLSKSKVRGSFSRNKLFWIGIPLCVVLIAMSALLYNKKSKSLNNIQSTQPSIALLPIRAGSEGARWQRLSFGLTNELKHELARNSWLSVYDLKDKNELQQLANNNQTPDFVLDGILYHESNSLRIIANLTEGDSKKVAWSYRWDTDPAGIFNVQDEILEKIGNSVGSTWTGTVSTRKLKSAQRKLTKNLDAYELYLLGNEHKHKFNEADYQIALDYLEKAVKIDPDFAKAWASIAIVHALRTSETEDGQKQIFDARMRAVNEAIRANPEDPDVLLHKSWVAHTIGDRKGAEKALRQAIEAAPNNADILAQAAWAGPERADVATDAVQWAERAIKLNPGHPTWYLTGLLTAAFHAGNYDLVLSASTQAPETLGRLTYELAAAVIENDSGRVAETRTKILTLNPEFTIDGYDKTDHIANDAIRKIFQEALEEAELPLDETKELVGPIKSAG